MVVAFDTETRGLDWTDPEERAFLASWADADGEYVADLGDADQAQRFINALNAADTLVCHNLSFDVHQVRATLGWDALHNGHTLHDTDLMSRVLFPHGQRAGRGGHGLKNLAVTFLDPEAKKHEEHIAEMAKAIGLRTLKQNGAYYEVWRAYPEVMETYAKYDARYTYDLYAKWIDAAEAHATYQLEQAVAPILIKAEEHGVAIDLAAAQRLADEYEPREVELHKRLTETLGEGALEGEGSRDRLREALIEAGVPLHRKSDTGLLRTDKFALAEFEDDYEVLRDLADWRRVTRFLDTYLSPMLHSGGTLHTSFMQCEAWTGRMSSRRPNVQNLPKRAGKEVRSPIVPREGHAFVVCDYDGIEARLLAYYMNDPDYRQMFREGMDPHAWMASMIHGGQLSDYAPGSELRPLRDTAKNTLFAITYGAGAPRVADMNKISRDEAKALISKIKTSLPKYNKLMGRIRKKVETQGHVNTLFGRKQVVNKDKAYVGLNALIQGSAADIMKQGLVNVAEAVEPLGGIPLLVVHDEVVVEVPTENADQALENTKQAMQDAYELDPPLEVSGSVVTTNYADA